MINASSSSAALASSSYQNAMVASATSSTGKRARTDADYTATAQKFEGMFMAQMLQPMFSSVDVDDTFGGGHGEEMMRGFMTQEYGKAMAANDTSGLSDAIKDQMIRLQETSNKGATVA
jgi:Rod binding domain-containing protein